MEKRRERRSSRLSTAIVPPCSSIRHSVSCPPPYFTNQLWQPSPQTFRDFVHSFGSLPLNHPRLLSSQLSNLLSKLPLWSSITFYPSSTPKKFPGKFLLFFFFSFFIKSKNGTRGETTRAIIFYQKLKKKETRCFLFLVFSSLENDNPRRCYIYICIHTYTYKTGKNNLLERYEGRKR